MSKGIPKRDGSGRGVRAMRGRGGCVDTRTEGKGRKMSDPIKRAKQLPTIHKVLILGLGVVAILVIYLSAGPLTTTPPNVVSSNGYVGICKFTFEFDPDPTWDNVGKLHFADVDFIDVVYIAEGLDGRKMEWVTLNYVGRIGTEVVTKNYIFEFSVETGFLVQPTSKITVIGKIPNALGVHSLTWNARVIEEDALDSGLRTDFYNFEYVGLAENIDQSFPDDSTWDMQRRGAIEKYLASFSPLPFVILGIVLVIVQKKKRR